ncbi:MAG: hypothetical protein A4E32_00499 [Methanomassiliicoccales archaeon PtaU1.Bin124]|nr:MAG: hypothetical protein A4E32_00499 [Methanomassiliicoccales archaeon PtaU1.Bin124]
MNKDRIVADTLFIDMKYVILYWILEYREMGPDIFEKDYGTLKIRIESEKQRFMFKDEWYPLTDHKDFVILECIDRLLRIGYLPDNLSLTNERNLALVKDDVPFLQIICEQWGEDYERAVSATLGNSDVIIYTSKLSGGLIDFKYEYLEKGKRFSTGVFEDNIYPFSFNPHNIASKNVYSDDFLVKNDVLLKYIGKEKNVVIPHGIEKIESGAFWNCTFLEEITIPDGVRSIGGDAFIYCDNLKMINIPSSIEKIGDDPFAGSANLLINNESPHFHLIKEILFDSDEKRLIHYGSHMKAERYEIPLTVEWIGKHSFYKNRHLKKVVITENVRFVGNNAFSDCENITLENRSPNFVYTDGSLLNKEQTTLIHYSLGTDQDEYVIPRSVRTVGRNSFWNCRRLKRIVITENVRQIGYNPFANCSNLEIICLSPYYKVEDGILYDKDGLELICCTSRAAFNGVSISQGVLSIGRNSFTGCESLKEIEIPPSVKTISRGAFSGCSNLQRVVLPDGVSSIGEWAFAYCPKLKNLEIGKGTKIAVNTFFGSNTEVRYR